jgi:hypothetical protein
MILLPAVLLGYLLGSIPTANGLARLRGVDLRKAGSGNPGVNNARRLGHPSISLSRWERVLLILPRQLANLRSELRAGGRRKSPAGSSPDPD